MIAATRFFQALTSRQPNLRTDRRCSSQVSRLGFGLTSERRTNRECLLANDRRDCLARLRQTALVETTRFLNARLVK